MINYWKKTKEKLSYEERVDEYIQKMKKQNIISLYNYYFSDGKNMYSWYQHETYKLSNEVKNKESISNERMKQIMMFATIDKYYYEEIISKKLPFSTKAKEYVEQVLRLKRNVRITDKLRFSNGDSMNGWLTNQRNTIFRMLDEEKPLTKEYEDRIRAIILLTALVNKFEPIKPLKFEQKASEYRNLIYEKGRKLEIGDNIRFSDGSLADTWYEKELKRYMKPSKINEYKAKLRMPVLLEIGECIISLDNEIKTNDGYVNRKIK